VAKQVEVAAVPVPDLTTLKNAPSVIEQPGLADSQKEGLIFRDCDACPELVSIAPGEFMVGPEGRGTAQQAITAVDAKRVVVDKPFAIGRYEITFDDCSVLTRVAAANRPMMAGDAGGIQSFMCPIMISASSICRGFRA
jgi:formylglycine-generating enzyme required for sulfatase activity